MSSAPKLQLIEPLFTYAVDMDAMRTGPAGIKHRVIQQCPTYPEHQFFGLPRSASAHTAP